MTVPSDASPAARPPLPRRTQWRMVATLAAALVAILAFIQWVPRWFAPPPPPPDAPVQAGFFRATEEQWSSLAIAPVKAIRFQAAVETEGKIALNDETSTPVISPYSGNVTKVFAHEGDSVRAGAPLFTVAAQEFVQAQNDLIAAAAALATAQKQLDLARVNAQRQQSLFEAKGGARKDLEQSRVDLAAAEGGLRTAEIAENAVRNRLRIFGKSDRDIDAIAQSPPGTSFGPETVVASPIAGTVVQRQISVGQNIVGSVAANGGSAPAFTVADLGTVRLLAYVPEADAPALRTGDKVEVRVAAFPGQVFAGTLNYVAASLDPTTHRLFVRAVIANPDQALKPEMLGEFRILTGEAVTAPGVPAEAVIYEGPQARVWVALKDRSLGLREIEAGRTQAGLVEVRSGLTAGESVVTSGSLFIDRAAHSE